MTQTVNQLRSINAIKKLPGQHITITEKQPTVTELQTDKTSLYITNGEPARNTNDNTKTQRVFSCIYLWSSVV
jgi:hypothetical protein